MVLTCDVLKADRVEEALDLVSFCVANNEPVLGTLIGPKLHDLKVFHPLKEMIVTEGLSTVVVDSETNKVVGCRLSSDSKEDNGTLPIDVEMYPQCKSFYRMWDHLKQLWAENRPNTVAKHELGYWIAVAVDPSYGNRGIGQQLYAENIRLLKSRGYKGAYCVCTSAFSSAASEKVGAKKICAAQYGTWEEENGFPLIAIKPPHVECCIREVNF